MRRLVILGLVCVILATLYYVVVRSQGSGLFRGSPIEGTWRGNPTKAMNDIYGRFGIAAQDASTIVTFHRGGTYTSDDSAILVAVDGHHKGTRLPYIAHCTGKFIFHEGKGKATEMEGRRSVGGKLIEVKMPDSISLRLRGRSSLEVTEDFGKAGLITYLLKRQ